MPAGNLSLNSYMAGMGVRLTCHVSHMFYNLDNVLEEQEEPLTVQQIGSLLSQYAPGTASDSTVDFDDVDDFADECLVSTSVPVVIDPIATSVAEFMAAKSTDKATDELSTAMELTPFSAPETTVTIAPSFSTVTTIAAETAPETTVPAIATSCAPETTAPETIAPSVSFVTTPATSFALETIALSSTPQTTTTPSSVPVDVKAAPVVSDWTQGGQTLSSLQLRRQPNGLLESTQRPIVSPQLLEHLRTHAPVYRLFHCDLIWTYHSDVYTQIILKEYDETNHPLVLRNQIISLTHLLAFPSLLLQWVLTNQFNAHKRALFTFLSAETKDLLRERCDLAAPNDGDNFALLARGTSDTCVVHQIRLHTPISGYTVASMETTLRFIRKKITISAALLTRLPHIMTFIQQHFPSVAHVLAGLLVD